MVSMRGFALASPRNMLLDCDMKKAIGANAYLIEREGGTASTFVLLTALYYADKSALINRGKPINGDSFASLDQRPISTESTAFLKGRARKKI